MSQKRLPNVLVVDGNRASLDEACLCLQHLNVTVHAASSGREALAIARKVSFELAVLDLELRDVSPLEIVAGLSCNQVPVPWILKGHRIDVDTALEAGRRGAVRAVNASADLQVAVAEALQCARQPCVDWPSWPNSWRLTEPKSNIRRGACLILEGCNSTGDLKTISCWAHFVGMSNTQLRETYSRIGVLPNAARDFMRLMRALGRLSGDAARVAAELDVRDYRTEAALLERAGMRNASYSRIVSPTAFAAAQRFLNPDHALTREVLSLIDDVVASKRSSDDIHHRFSWAPGPTVAEP